MVTDDANGGTAAQQHEVRAHTRQGHAMSVQSGVGATDALRVASRPALATFLRQHERDVAWVFAACAR